MEKISVNEDMHPEKEWYADARKITLEKLPEFVQHVMNDYEHDYGTVCKAIASCALAATYAANKENGSSGGITGFQASCVMWEFVRAWLYTDNKCGMRLINFDDMLYPQSEYRFDKHILRENWENVQKEAKRRLEEYGEDAHPSVIAHWKSIIDGNVPFDYYIEE